MKRTLIFFIVFAALSACGRADQEADYAPGFFDAEIDTTQEDMEGGETNTELPSEDPVEEVSTFVVFAQTTWNECTADVTGNYVGIGCAKARGISVILDGFLQQRLLACVDAGLKAVGTGKTAEMHVTHAGIAGDAKHSPRSLHAHKRAIDVKSIEAKLTDGTTRLFDYAKASNRPFYAALRKCWGNTVKTYNGCPLYRGDASLTGSIGWENSSHGRHMHLSVPYCLSGRYGSGVWQR